MRNLVLNRHEIEQLLDALVELTNRSVPDCLPPVYVHPGDATHAHRVQHGHSIRSGRDMRGK